MSEIVQTPLLERYLRLAEISLDLASTLELDGLLKRIVQAAADLSQAEAASILLYDENKQQLYFESATNLEEPLMRGLIVPVEGSIAGWVVTHRQPIIIADTQKDPRHFGNIAKATKVTTTSMLGVPLIAKDKVIGTLEAINNQVGGFTEDDQDVLMALAAQAAVAIENARLFQQSDLIAELVHELRTPLASLSTAAHLLLRDDVPDEHRKRVVQIIHNETDRLTNMTSVFLDLARLESGRMQFQIQVFELYPLLEECASMMRGKAAENGLRLELEASKDLPPLRADRDKIKQVILNLLSNGIKYNRPGGDIAIHASFELDHFMILVRDTGLGIPATDLEHLFEKFYRVQSVEQIATGTGLGLAICKRIVEAHGGKIRATSELDVGTTFTISLPAKAS